MLLAAARQRREEEQRSSARASRVAREQTPSGLSTGATSLMTSPAASKPMQEQAAHYQGISTIANKPNVHRSPPTSPGGEDQQQAHLVLKVAVVKGPAAEPTLDVDLLHLEALGIPIAKDSSPFSLSERSRSDSAEHCGSTPAKLPAPSAPSSLSVRSSADFAVYGSSTPASLSAPSGPSWLSERKKSNSDGHCGAIVGNSWLPNPGLTKRRQFFLDESEDDDSEDSMSRESSLSCSGPGFLGYQSQAAVTREGSLTTIHSQTDSTSISRQGIISLTMQRVIRLERKRVGKV